MYTLRKPVGDQRDRLHSSTTEKVKITQSLSDSLRKGSLSGKKTEEVGQKGSDVSHAHSLLVLPHNSPKEEECGGKRGEKWQVKRKGVEQNPEEARQRKCLFAVRTWVASRK